MWIRRRGTVGDWRQFLRSPKSNSPDSWQDLLGFRSCASGQSSQRTEQGGKNKKSNSHRSPVNDVNLPLQVVFLAEFAELWVLQIGCFREDRSFWWSHSELRSPRSAPGSPHETHHHSPKGLRNNPKGCPVVRRGYPGTPSHRTFTRNGFRKPCRKPLRLIQLIPWTIQTGAPIRLRNPLRGKSQRRPMYQGNPAGAG